MRPALHLGAALALLGALAWVPSARAEPDDDAQASAEEQIDALVGRLRELERLVADGPEISLDFDQTELSQVVAYFAELTGIDLISPTKLRGKISIIARHPMPRAVAAQVILTALDDAGWTVVRHGKFYTLTATKDARSQPLPTVRTPAGGAPAERVTWVVTPKHTAVSDLKTLLTALAGEGARIIPWEPSGRLIVVDTRADIARMARVVEDLDVAADPTHVVVIPLRYAEASEMKEVVESLFGATETSQSTARSRSSRARRSRRSRRARRARSQRQATTSQTEVGSAQPQVSKVLADERSNALVLRATEDGIAAVRDVLAELDVDVDAHRDAQVHVIYLEHADAEEMAQLIQNLIQESTSSRPSRGRSSRTSSRRTGRLRASQIKGNQPLSAAQALTEGMTVTSDEGSNALALLATPDQLTAVRQVVDALDLARPQVFLDTVLVELAAESSSELGIAGHSARAGSAGGLSFFSTQEAASSVAPISADVLTGLALGVVGPDLDTTVTDPITGESTTLAVPTFGVALSALAGDSRVEIMSAPSVLAMDNEEATVTVGRNVPFPTSTGRDANNNPIVSYQREDVGLELTITPRITAGDDVALEVDQEVQEIEEDDQGLDPAQAGFITSKRSLNATVVVPDDKTVVLSGLSGITSTEVASRVPGLGQLPLVGALFSGTRMDERRTDLLLFLTPHVIRCPEDLRRVLAIKQAQRELYRRRFGELDDAERQAALYRWLGLPTGSP